MRAPIPVRQLRLGKLLLGLVAIAAGAGCPSKGDDTPPSGPAAGTPPTFIETAIYGKETGFFLSVAFSPDGHALAAGDTNGDLRIWSRQTAKETRKLTAHRGLLIDLAWSPDGRTLATVGGADVQAKLWDVETGTTRGTLDGHGGPVKCVDFSPDGRRLATGAADQLIWIWDARTRRGVRTLAGHTAAVLDVRFSPDGKRLASGSADRSVRLWDLDAGRAVRTHEGLADGVSCVTFSPDGQRLGADSGSDAEVWSVETGKKLRTLSGEALRGLRGVGKTVVGVAFGGDGAVIATAHKGGAVHIWGAAGETPPVLVGKDSTFVVAPAFTPDGKRLAVAGKDGVRLWMAASPPEQVGSPGGAGPR